jgi:hypothetical protein
MCLEDPFLDMRTRLPETTGVSIALPGSHQSLSGRETLTAWTGTAMGLDVNDKGNRTAYRWLALWNDLACSVLK